MSPALADEFFTIEPTGRLVLKLALSGRLIPREQCVFAISLIISSLKVDPMPFSTIAFFAVSHM